MAGTDERDELERGGAERGESSGVRAFLGGAASAPFGGLGRTVNSFPRDLHNIAESVRVLPELLATLVRIDRRVHSLDTEVREMRRSVDRLHSDIAVLTNHVDGVQTSLHPLGRIRERLRRAEADDSAVGGAEGRDDAGDGYGGDALVNGADGDAGFEEGAKPTARE